MVLSWKVKVLKSYGCKTQETIFFNLVLKYLLSCFKKPKQPYFLKPHLVFKTQEPLYWLMSLQEAFSYYFQVRISDYPISDQISPHHYPFHYNYPPIIPRGDSRPSLKLFGRLQFMILTLFYPFWYFPKRSKNKSQRMGSTLSVNLCGLSFYIISKCKLTLRIYMSLQIREFQISISVAVLQCRVCSAGPVAEFGTGEREGFEVIQFWNVFSFLESAMCWTSAVEDQMTLRIQSCPNSALHWWACRSIDSLYIYAPDHASGAQFRLPGCGKSTWHPLNVFVLIDFVSCLLFLAHISFQWGKRSRFVLPGWFLINLFPLLIHSFPFISEKRIGLPGCGEGLAPSPLLFILPSAFGDR